MYARGLSSSGLAPTLSFSARLAVWITDVSVFLSEYNGGKSYSQTQSKSSRSSNGSGSATAAFPTVARWMFLMQSSRACR